MKYKTLIATGCSYTHYNWDTWADYLGRSFENYQNLGYSGSGPRYSWLQIQNYLKHVAKYSTIEDTVIAVQWSSLLRNDLFTASSEDGNYFKAYHHWVGGGQVNNNDNYSQEYLDNYFRVTDKALDLMYYIETLILAAEKYKFKLIMFHMLEPWLETFGGEPTGGAGLNKMNTQIDDFYNSEYPSLLKAQYTDQYWIKPSIELFTAGVPDPNKDPNDHHPSPLQHLHYSQHIKKCLGIN